MLFLAPLIALFGMQKFLTSQIAARVEREVSNASGVSVSLPITNLPRDLMSKEITSVKIAIDRYFLTGNKSSSTLSISAKNIRIDQPQVVGFLDVAATIPLSTIIQSSEFSDAQIQGNALLVPVGAGGAGRALLVPRHRGNLIFFELLSVSFLGNEIPLSSLPDNFQIQIKSKSERNLKLPEGINVKSVALSTKGFSLNLSGSNVRLSQLGAGIEVEP